jgi:hypothetical protein
MKNKERIALLEKRIEDLEKNAQPTQVLLHKDGSVTVYPNSDITRSYHEMNPLETVKLQVIELLKRINIPQWAIWVAVDKDSEFWVYDGDKPTFAFTTWQTESLHNMQINGKINLNGADWTKCCWRISDLLNERSETANTTVNESLTTDKERSVKDKEQSNIVILPFNLDEVDVLSTTKNEFIALSDYCEENNIDPSKIKHIALHMEN